jgi:hypothetical protein
MSRNPYTPPHPYAAAASHLTAATSNLQEARNAHARAYQGNGSDTTTAESIRATVRALHRYLDETSQPHTVPEEEEQETALERARRRADETETASAHAAQAAEQAYANRDRIELALHQAQSKAQDAYNQAKTTEYAAKAAREEAARLTAAQEDRK